MRVTVPSPWFVTQTEPAPAAIADGSLPTPTDPSFRPEAGSIRRDDPVGIDDPERPERRERRSHAAAEEARSSERPRQSDTVIPRVDLRDAALAAGHPDGVLRGGERRRRVADRNRGQRLSRGHVDACHAPVVEVRDPQPAGAGRDRDGARADRDRRSRPSPTRRSGLSSSPRRPCRKNRREETKE